MDEILKLSKNDIGEDVDPSLYRNLVGSLMYLTTIRLEILFAKVPKSVLVGFCDSDWHDNVDNHKSTSGYVFSIGLGVFSYTLKKQLVVALSTTEVEYIALSAAGCEALWLR
ncbi:secreted RxLR effector protein 161-like [Benincasa hispida]|uniref:secreted RxLR effector protein 161-like n=1 Tax=Benincasa hispida TaxID=102211 RepID=UPI0019017AD7|nr:secreted RxLR effector protein 161-like [Benincasa hispida]